VFKCTINPIILIKLKEINIIIGTFLGDMVINTKKIPIRIHLRSAPDLGIPNFMGLRYRLIQFFLDIKAMLITKLEVRAFKTEDKAVW
jgi:hypothetical protein